MIRKKFFLRSLKYIVTTIFFVVWIAFFDDYSLRNQRKWKNELKRIETALTETQQRIIEYKFDNALLSSDIEEMERVGRNIYNMKRDNEDVYIFQKIEDSIAVPFEK